MDKAKIFFHMYRAHIKRGIHGFIFFCIAVLMWLLTLELLLRLWGFAVIYANRDNQITTSKDFVILTLGESTTAGKNPDTWPRQLEKILQLTYPDRSIHVINQAVPGTNTSIIAGNLKKQIIQFQPDVVVSMIGINDSRVDSFRFFPTDISEPPGVFLSLQFFRRVLDSAKNLFVYMRDMYVDHDAHKLNQKGEQFRIFGQYGQAEKYFLRCITIDPANAGHYVHLALLYRDVSRNLEAERMLLKAKEVNPKSEGVYTELGNFYRDNGQTVLAGEMYEIALRLNPQYWLAYSEYGTLNSWFLNDDEKASVLYRSAIQYNPKFLAPYFELAEIYRKRNRLDIAVGLFEKVLEIDSNNANAMASLAVIEQNNRASSASGVLSLGVLPVSDDLHPMTKFNYRRIIDIAGEYHIPVIAVQYPLQSALPLTELFAKDMREQPASIFVVENKKNFQDALRGMRYQDLFTDYFGGNFGHATREGNKLIAQQIGPVIDKLIILQHISP